jgi:hypothetical protein
MESFGQAHIRTIWQLATVARRHRYRDPLEGDALLREDASGSITM